ncbi:MAG: hypothetical protein A3H96_10600 [Acidobacteria bacterium RIFCSPLOWO2_02_FULL_67_36]|nr:MAG: hypothetical protein A3H96_10600 [Acidobacteria bacterium RIFCSPLOWO2_02_FULL_67_36]OFW24374.1 MAG: hypothetical protein A3G21_17570 [Acidobacteria bacterium RIFCSPLOWO2_12_FULL_66_21]
MSTPSAAEPAPGAATATPSGLDRAETRATTAEKANLHAASKALPRTERAPAVTRQEPRSAGVAAPQAAPAPVPVAHVPDAAAPPAPPVEAVPESTRAPESAPVATPQFDEVVLPSSSVIGLEVETPLSSERSRVEDRVDARVTRDVLSAGRVAIPAGSRVLGSVTVVERGGKLRERARLGVRFHTLVLADGHEVPLRSETIYREGDSPRGEGTRKIGGAAIGGAILGGILGGGKGAAIGGAAGAAGGTAAVMAGDRNAATLPSGTIVTVRLAAPVTIEIERK